MSITPDVVNKASRSGIESTLTVTESSETAVIFAFNRLKSIQNSESLSSTLQVIKDGRLGMSTTTSDERDDELLEKAIAVSTYGSPVSYKLPDPEPHANPIMYHKEVDDLTLDKMIRLGEGLSVFLNGLHPDVNGSVQIKKSIARHTIRNTRGLNDSWKNTGFSISIGADLVEGKNLLSVLDIHLSVGLSLDLESMKDQIRSAFELGRHNVPVEPGQYDVVFTHFGFSDIIQSVIQCLDGKAIDKGISPFADRLGDKVLSPLLTIYDDGAMDNAIGSRHYDDQGVACRKVPLIDDGVLTEYLLDLETASRLGRKPTGTGGASGVSPNNLVVMPGTVAKTAMISGLKRGIVIEQTMGAWTGNPYSGQVTGNIALGFLVVDGVPVGRVKDCMFSVNVFRHLSEDLLSLSKEVKCVGDTTLPWALVRNVSVSAKRK